MNEIIVNLLNRNYPNFANNAMVARDIELLLIMFIDWLAMDVTLKLVWKDDVGYVKQWSYKKDWGFSTDKDKTQTLDELFKYWFENIRGNER